MKSILVASKNQMACDAIRQTSTPEYSEGIGFRGSLNPKWRGIPRQFAGVFLLEGLLFTNQESSCDRDLTGASRAKLQAWY